MKLTKESNGIKLSKISLNFLEKSIREQLEISKPVKFKKQVNGSRLRFETNTILNETGVFKNILKECVISSFGGGEIVDGLMCGSVNLSYSHKDGGSNGLQICTYVYHISSDTWEISF
jgi:hypothetical protein